MLLQNLKDHMENSHNSTEVRVLGQKSLIELFGNKVKDSNVKRKRGHSDVDEEPLLKTAKTGDLSMSISSGSTPPGFFFFIYLALAFICHKGRVTTTA